MNCIYWEARVAYIWRPELYILGGQSCIYLKARVVYIGRPPRVERQFCLGQPMGLLSAIFLLPLCFWYIAFNFRTHALPMSIPTCAGHFDFMTIYLMCPCPSTHPSQQKYDFHCFEPFLVQCALLRYHILIYDCNCKNFLSGLANI